MGDFDVSGKTFFEGDKSFCAFDSFYFLQFIVENETQLEDVFADNFREHAVVAGGIIEANDLGNFSQLSGYRIVQGAFFQIDTNESYNIITQQFEVY